MNAPDANGAPASADQLRASIAALEAQRPILGDAVVEPALVLLRRELAERETGIQPAGHQRKQVTILFADVANSTRLAQQIEDPEELLEIMNTALRRLSAPIESMGGQIATLMGDGFIGVFGLPVVQEDDAERAVRAGLAILDVARDYAADLAEARGLRDFDVRVGVNTGLVAASGGAEGEGGETFMGLAVNLAARLEAAAAPGSLLISHFTYGHVRGIFKVLALEPIRAKGFPDPVPVYQVTEAKARAFRVQTRGIEGIETRMIGREEELFTLQHAYADAAEDSQARVVLVHGDAGVGKSRLLYEFDNWVELRPEKFYYFKGRAIPSTAGVAYGLFRDLFAYRFDILDSDSPRAALDKFRAGFTLRPGPGENGAGDERADLVGHWLGFDFSASPTVARLLGSPEFGRSARDELLAYFAALVDERPVVMFLEDIHWADDASLDLLQHLAVRLAENRLLVICLARRAFLEGRPSWGRDIAGFFSLELQPLNPLASRALVNEILQKATDVPLDLVDLIVNRADGNPFYVEELVKMLIDEGVIVPGEDRWALAPERMQSLRVPSTLTGVLQARLDSLPTRERALLQRASVIGRAFWDNAVAALAAAPSPVVADILDSLLDRELILLHERSVFAGAEEFVFKHALLRDVTYETVPLRLRRDYHARAARWLEDHAGDRLSEYLEVIAEHYIQAGDNEAAAEYLERAGGEALRASAFGAAMAVLLRAVDLMGMDWDGRPKVSAGLQLKLAETCWHLGEFAAGDVWAGNALAAAQLTGDPAEQAEALYWMSQIATSLGDYGEAQALLVQSLPLARRSRPETLARVLYGLGDVGSRSWQGAGGDAVRLRAYLEESLDLARELGDVSLQLFALNRLGALANQTADYDTAGHIWSECLALAISAGNRERQAAALTNLGFAAFFRGDFAEAAAYTRQALVIDQDLGRQDAIAHDLLNLAEYETLLGDTEAARRDLHDGLELAWQMGTTPRVLHGLFVHASLLVNGGQQERAVPLLRMLRGHPAGDADLHNAADEMLAELGEPPFPAPELDLDLLVTQVLGVKVQPSDRP